MQARKHYWSGTFSKKHPPWTLAWPNAFVLEQKIKAAALMVNTARTLCICCLSWRSMHPACATALVVINASRLLLISHACLQGSSGQTQSGACGLQVLIATAVPGDGVAGCFVVCSAQFLIP